MGCVVDGEGMVSVLTGIWHPGGYWASWPFVRVRFDRDCLEVGASFLPARFRRHVARREVRHVWQVKSWRGRGFLFDATGGRLPYVIAPLNPGRFEAALRSLGWPLQPGLVRVSDARARARG